MSEYETALSSRVDTLEKDLATVSGQLTMVVALMASARLKAFDTPWEKFLDGPGFFEDPNKTFRCYVGCADDYNAQMASAGGDRAKERAASDALTSCRRKCDGG
ncbi:MAG: hypothetical protein V2I65_19270 [Paracoccaceae bacterium]|jgi:hypothetical protein|nr:hypothetical protein [Paracoccaceae bacterium]